jgi:predicted permease
MNKLLFSLTLVVLGVTCGYLFQHLYNRDIITLRTGLNPLKKKIQRVTFLLLNPLAIVGATWVAKLEDMALIALPALCLVSLSLGAILAYSIARMFKMGRKQTGAYLGCGVFTNIGALGALFCFIFLGEPGFALVPIYKIFEEFCYFAFLFPVAKSFSLEKSEDKFGIMRRILTVLADIYVFISVASIGLGLVLNLTGVPRPEIYAAFNAVNIPVIVFLLLFSIGLGMRFSNIGRHIYPALAITGAKFICIPVIVTGLGLLAGLHTIDNGLPLKVVIILSAMPVGFMSVIPPSLYDLDVDLANACWLVCNSLLLIQVPILLFIVSNLPF